MYLELWMRPTSLKRWGNWIVSLIPLSMLGVVARIASDAMHISGFYDSLGAMCASTSIGPIPSLLTGIISGVLLIPYYEVYLAAFWIPGLTGLVYGLLRRKGYPTLGAVLSSLVYVLGWAIVYCLATGTWGSISSYLLTKGALVLYLDVFICSAISEVYVKMGKPSVKALLVMGLVSLAAIGGFWTVTKGNEWGIVEAFPEREGWMKFHSKMDLVWIWMGEKGINNYYYPETRFDREKPGYQVWVGLYWVQGWHDVADVSLDSEFAVWDQNFWNGIHGAKDPYTYVIDVHNITKINFKGYRAYLMYGGMITQSDVEPYEEVWIEGFFITFYDNKADRTAIIYACATKENLPKIIDELWDLVNSWKLGPS
ncbi:MAG TPA: hypothetical protein EYP68_05635 [Candidatus Korarchaeota archaeon]|nr:hypothetical protein [Candidatus Korarchaeota archaeon]